MIQEMGVDAFLAVTTDLGIDIFLPNKEEGAMLTGAQGARRHRPRAHRDLPGCAGDPQARRRRRARVARRTPRTTSRRPPTTSSTPPAPATRSPAASSRATSAACRAVEAATFATSVSAWVIEHPGARPVARRPPRRRARLGVASGSTGDGGTRGRCGGRRTRSSSTIASCGSSTGRRRPTGSAGTP